MGRPCRGSPKDVSQERTSWSWEMVGPCRGSPPADRMSKPVCLVQRLPLFEESQFELVWEGSGGGQSLLVLVCAATDGELIAHDPCVL